MECGILWHSTLKSSTTQNPGACSLQPKPGWSCHCCQRFGGIMIKVAREGSSCLGGFGRSTRSAHRKWSIKAKVIVVFPCLVCGETDGTKGIPNLNVFHVSKNNLAKSPKWSVPVLQTGLHIQCHRPKSLLEFLQLSPLPTSTPSSGADNQTRGVLFGSWAAASLADHLVFWNALGWNMQMQNIRGLSSSSPPKHERQCTWIITNPMFLHV